MRNFIVFEGPDGVGKTTQVTQLAARLRNEGWLNVVELREPTTGPWGQRIREAARTGRVARGQELMWFVLDRFDNVARNVRPALEQGAVVVQDRYYFTTAAYQSTRDRSRPQDPLIDPQTIIDMHAAFAPEPGLVVYLDCDRYTARQRLSTRAGGTDLFEAEQFQLDLRETFVQVLNKMPAHVQLLCIDTSHQPVDVVHEQVWQAVRTLLGSP